MTPVAVLFARADSVYKAMPGTDVVKSAYRKTIAVGCGSPVKARGISRNTARYAAFSIPATSFGGSDGMAKAMPGTLRVPPVFHTHSSCRPVWKWSGSCSQAQLDEIPMSDTEKSIGLCGCGCGQKTKLAKKNRPELGHIKGEPMPFMNGHHFTEPPSDEVLSERAKKAADRKTAWRRKNAEHVRQLDAARRERNREHIRSKNVEWVAKNKAHCLELSRAWAANNPEKSRAAKERYRLANSEKYRIYTQNRRARVRENGGELSPDIAVRLFALQRGKCACCARPLGSKYQLDHIVPIFSGGPNVDSNMQLLTERCNKQKRAIDPITFMQSRGFLL